jgi:cytochrome c oxidase subunit IV
MASTHDAHPGEHPHAGEHSHPGAKEYVVVAIVLAFLTSVEVAIYYLDFIRPFLAHLLILLSAAKFFLVGSFFMHLKFDNRLFSSLFVGGLILAISLGIALLALFHNLFV